MPAAGRGPPSRGRGRYVRHDRALPDRHHHPAAYSTGEFPLARQMFQRSRGPLGAALSQRSAGQTGLEKCLPPGSRSTLHSFHPTIAPELASKSAPVRGVELFASSLDPAVLIPTGRLDRHTPVPVPRGGCGWKMPGQGFPTMRPRLGGASVSRPSELSASRGGGVFPLTIVITARHWNAAPGTERGRCGAWRRC